MTVADRSTTLCRRGTTRFDKAADQTISIEVVDVTEPQASPDERWIGSEPVS